MRGMPTSETEPAPPADLDALREFAAEYPGHPWGDAAARAANELERLRAQAAQEPRTDSERIRAALTKMKRGFTHYDDGTIYVHGYTEAVWLEFGPNGELTDLGIGY